MNSRQREYLKYTLGREEFFIESLKRLYQNALDDINTRIADLRGRSDLENLQSIIYQLNYQQSLRKQVNAILDDLHGKEYSTMEDYLRECYDNGFIGTMYDIHGQGIPLVLPIDQDNVLRSLTINSKLSKSLYESLGEDISKLKDKVRINISRGFASNMSFADIARNISNVSKIGVNNAIRIARTEGHRIQTEATMDAQQEAKNNGADIVKQWDATLDGRTRLSHRKLDGQIRELDEDFEVNGHKAKAPHHFGLASEDINCRCALLQRARWALDDDGTITKMDNEKKELVEIKAKDYDSFKDSYFKELDKQNKKDSERTNQQSSNEENSNNKNASVVSSDITQIENNLNYNKVAYNDVKPLVSPLTEQEIIDRLSGGDMTKGSCSSLAFAYIGNKGGLDVLDYRGDKGREIFANDDTIEAIANLKGVKSIIIKDSNDFRAVNKLLSSVGEGKRYYLSTGRHAAIIRKNGKDYEYLELQSWMDNGFKELNDIQLEKRFKCKLDHTHLGIRYEVRNILIDTESLYNNSDFRRLLGYINTESNKQKKGVKGRAK